MLQVGIVGAGYWGPNLIRNVARLPNAHPRWVCDLSRSCLSRIKDQYPSTSVTEDLEDLLGDEELAAVILATPTETHAELGLRILEAGKHLMVEKPLATTVRDARMLVERAEARELVLLVGHTFEYNAAVRKVRELIESGEVGEVYYLYSQRVNLGKIRDDCNAMWSLAPHDVSIANYLIGEAPAWVSAMGHRFLGRPIEDVVFLTAGYPGGRVAHIHVSWLDPNKIRQTTIVGSKKMVVYDDMSIDAKVKIYDKGVNKADGSRTAGTAPPFGEFQYLTRTGDLSIPRIDFREPLHEEVSHFVACVEDGAAPRTGGRNGLAVVEVLEAAQASLEAGGRTVELA